MDIKKLSEHLHETVPDIKLEDARRAIIAYREYMFNLRNGKMNHRNHLSNYCDVCYNLISERESAQTKMTDFNYCCDKHAEFRNHFQLDLVRKQIGLTVEHLPHIDIYG